MIIGVLIFVACLGAVFGIIAVHECGHFLAGRIAGIPAGAMQVRLLAFPQHVALRSDGRWLHPSTEYEQYAQAAMGYLQDRRRAVLYVAGGLAVQSVAFAALLAALAAVGVPRFWVLPVAGAMASVPVLYLGADVIFTALSRKPCGDFSFLWRISPASSILVTLFTLIAHGAALWGVMR
jgi:hypothetical protein